MSRSKKLPSQKRGKDKRVQVDIPAEIMSMTRSMFEARVLTNLINCGVTYQYETVVIPYLEPEHKRRYTPDIILSNKIIVEVKGKLDADDRKKMLLVKEQHPEYDIRFLFMRDNKLTKSSKTMYSTWAAKHGFPYAVSPDGIIPEEWVNESTRSYDLD